MDSLIHLPLCTTQTLPVISLSLSLSLSLTHSLTLTHTADSADHSITDQRLSVLWSFGQVFPDYFHNPGSGIEAVTAQNTRFYQPDEIKYHGARNRGSTSINFFDVDSNTNDICSGEFSTGCDAQGQSCDYRATWEVQGFNVEYTVTARQVQNGRTEWVAIGFSDDRIMVSMYLYRSIDLSLLH